MFSAVSKTSAASISAPFLDSSPTRVDVIETLEDAIEDRITKIVEKLGFLAAHLEDEIDRSKDDGGDLGGFHEVLQQEAPITNDGGNGDDSAQVSANQGEGGNQTHQTTAKEKSKGIFLSKFKRLVSAISKMCKCLDDRGGTKKAGATSIVLPPGSSEDKVNHGDFGGLDGVVGDIVISGNVYGRYHEREQLVKMLLEPGEENVSVIPITGNGGIGKTTLVHCVYSDERVEQYFHTRVWVCASDTFDMMRIAGELEESLYLRGPLDQSQLLDLYEKNLLAELKGKRFLVVLDDVKSVGWALRFAAVDTDVKGSKILLTTGEERMVDEESKRKKIVLKGIRGEEFWAFFKKCSFGDEDPNTHPELERIGKRIAERLEGSPLAAKMVGGVLREKLNYSHWMSILGSELWEIGKTGGDVLPYLRLSYQHLPIHLQRCFAYCSVFPSGYAFEIEKLVHIWIAQGLIRPVFPTRMEDIGREYFDHLLHRSFFELPSYSKSYWQSKYYLMHELLYDLAVSVCLDDSLVYGGQDLGGTRKGICHLSVSLWAGLNSEFEWKNLRTLIINTKHVTELELLKRVRVLDLSHSYMRQVPDSIGCLIHLRYLNLSGNYIHSLPESLCRLYHLQSLIVPDKCHRLPKGITCLVSLRHLNANEMAVTWIAGIGRLTRLQELKVFHVRKAKGHDIGQLKSMKELRGQLCIDYLDDVKSKEESLEANLKDKIHLRKLQLKWMRWNRNRNPDAHEDILDCLKPPLGLKELEIHWYRGLRSPSWFGEQSLQNLQVLHLRGCDKWNHLPSLGKLPFLQVLKLEFMDAVAEVAGDAANMFPSLKELWLQDTSVTFEGKPIVSEQRHNFFPCICKLSVRNCNRVKGLPPLSVLQTLEELDVKKCPDLDAEMPGCLINLTSLTTLKVSELKLTYFPGETLQWLKHLEIDSCENLKSWLADEKEEGCLSAITSLCITDTLLPTGPILNYLTSLHELRLSRCSKLMSFTSEQKKWFKELTLLNELSITDSKNLTSLPMDLHHLPSLVKLTIRGCPSIRSLPRDLPISLKMLEFSNCNPGLAVLWQDEKAPDYVKRVPYRYIV